MAQRGQTIYVRVQALADGDSTVSPSALAAEQSIMVPLSTPLGLPSFILTPVAGGANLTPSFPTNNATGYRYRYASSSAGISGATIFVSTTRAFVKLNQSSGTIYAQMQSTSSNAAYSNSPWTAISST